ncbi:MAG: ABC-F family ATP-binding cassette domain-containing protein [Tenuifilaceae bacterium]|jgi:ATP-binding cassette subfamily F protein 3|nr:ABC-F family ATP-binding cassette domain-containing protein [Tenuifilaceae bacterium]
MISANQVAVDFGTFQLFKDVSFLVGEKDRIGLVGRNGAGKSTLLRLIVGEMRPTSGEFSMPSGTRIGYLPQTMALADGKTVMQETLTAFSETQTLEREIADINHQLGMRTDYESDDYMKLIARLTEKTERYNLLGGVTAQAQCELALLGLGFRRTDFDRITSEFSGGWRMRIELAKILLSRPNLLLLDEPTNHLDIESIQWLEDYLQTFSGAVILISHDRAFLDNVTNRTIELSLGVAFDYKVSYSKYVELHKERREQQIATYRNQQKLIEDTQDFIDRFRYKASKSAQVQSRIKQLDRMEVIEVDDIDNSALNIKFPPAPRSGDIAIELAGVGKSFGEKRIFSDATFTLTRGEKIALVGRNGEGKTTLSRMIIGELQGDGKVKLGHNVSIGYFAQNQDELLDGNLTVLDTIDRVAVGDVRTKIRDILGAFLFRGEDVDKKVSVLSGGERNRLAMAKLMLMPYNFLLLDEPTNHLDMRSKDILKEALKSYEGTLILVSHDREFLDGLVDKLYEFRDGKVREHLGGIYEFLRRRKLENMQELERRAKEVADSKPKSDSEQKQSYLERKEMDKLIRKVASRLEQVEKDITKTEAEIAKIDGMLANPAEHGIDHSDKTLFTQYDGLKTKLAKLMEEWEEVTMELEELKEKREM